MGIEVIGVVPPFAFKVVIHMQKIGDIEKIVQQISSIAEEGQPISSEPLPPQTIKMPQLALVMANYFNSLSKYCLSVYYGHTRNDSNVQKKGLQMRVPQVMRPPKKPVSAYIRYYGQKYSEYQQKYPSYSISQLTKLVAQDWTKLSQSIKEPYTTGAAKDRKRYQEELQKFRESNQGYEQKSVRKKKKTPAKSEKVQEKPILLKMQQGQGRQQSEAEVMQEMSVSDVQIEKEQVSMSDSYVSEGDV